MALTDGSQERTGCARAVFRFLFWFLSRGEVFGDTGLSPLAALPVRGRALPNFVPGPQSNRRARHERPTLGRHWLHEGARGLPEAGGRLGPHTHAGSCVAGHCPVPGRGLAPCRSCGVSAPHRRVHRRAVSNRSVGGVDWGTDWGRWGSATAPTHTARVSYVTALYAVVPCGARARPPFFPVCHTLSCTIHCSSYVLHRPVA